MSVLPKKVQDAWEEREEAVVLSTVGSDGCANAIYASCAARYDESTLVIADNYFDKTRRNIESGSKGSVLFITKEGTSYQIKGSLELHEEGTFFDFMKTWNPAKLPGRAAAALRVEEVYSGAEKLL